MARGQAEALFPMLRSLLVADGCDWASLSAIAVGTGPGNFTGIRIAVAAARGMAMSLDIPSIGVTGFEALSLDATDLAWATIPAPRDQIYVQLIGAWDSARLMSLEDARTEISRHPAPLLGFLAPDPVARPDPVSIARVGEQRLKSVAAIKPPAPTYIKPPDAAPSRDAPPVILT